MLLAVVVACVAAAACAGPPLPSAPSHTLSFAECNASALTSRAQALLASRFSPVTGTTSPNGGPPAYARTLDSLLISMANAVRGEKGRGGAGSCGRRTFLTLGVPCVFDPLSVQYVNQHDSETELR